MRETVLRTPFDHGTTSTRSSTIKKWEAFLEQSKTHMPKGLETPQMQDTLAVQGCIHLIVAHLFALSGNMTVAEWGETMFRYREAMGEDVSCV